MFFLQDNLPLLSILILSPLTGIVFLLQIKSSERSNIRNCTIWISIFTFLIALFISLRFNENFDGLQFIENYKWLAYYEISYTIGIDEVSITLIMLITFLMPIAIILGFDNQKENFRSKMIMFLCLEAFLIGFFCSVNIILLYMFSEATMFSFLLISNIWNDKDSGKSFTPFFIMICLTSAMLLIIFLKFSYDFGSPNLETFKYAIQQTPPSNAFLMLIIFVLFLRMGIFPFFNWSSNIYTETTKSTSFIFTTLITIVSSYYAIRFIPLVLFHKNTLILLTILTVIFLTFVSSIANLRQCIKNDKILKLVPYISQINTCFIIVGLIATNKNGNRGAILVLSNFCLVTAGAFLLPSFLTNINKKLGKLLKFINFEFLAISYLLFSFLGLPGFSGKSLILLALLKNQCALFVIVYIMFMLFFILFFINNFHKLIQKEVFGKAFPDVDSVVSETKEKIGAYPVIAFFLIMILLFFVCIMPRIIFRNLY